VQSILPNVNWQLATSISNVKWIDVDSHGNLAAVKFDDTIWTATVDSQTWIPMKGSLIKVSVSSYDSAIRYYCGVNTNSSAYCRGGYDGGGEYEPWFNIPGNYTGIDIDDQGYIVLTNIYDQVFHVSFGRNSVTPI